MANDLQNKLDAILADKNANLLPENLRKGITLLGVNGTLESGGSIEPIHIHKDAVEGPTVTVSVQNDSLYGFVDDGDGWYRNNNQGVDMSTASATFIVNTSDATTIDILVEQSSEESCDYGMINDVSYQTLNGSTTQKIQLNKGDNTIVVRYVKDGSVSNGTDTFRLKFDLSSIQGSEEIDLDVHVTHFASMDDMRNDTECPIDTFAITYIDALSANIYRKTSAGWVFVGISNNDNFKHSNVLRGVKIGELTGSYIHSSELNGMQYDKTTGNIGCALHLDISGSSAFQITNAYISISPNNIGTLDLQYINNTDTIIQGVLYNGTTIDFTTTDGTTKSIAITIPNCICDTCLSMYLNIDAKWTDVPCTVELDTELEGVEITSITARYSAVFKILNYTFTVNNTSNNTYEAISSVEGISGDNYILFYSNMYDVGMGADVTVLEPMTSCTIRVKYTGKTIQIDNKTYSFVDEEDESRKVDIVCYGTYYDRADTEFISIGVNIMTQNMDGYGYLGSVSFTDNTGNINTLNISGVNDTSFGRDFTVNGITNPVEFDVSLTIVNGETQTVMENGTLTINNHKGTEITKLTNVNISGNDIDGYTLCADMLDCNYPNYIHVSIEDTFGRKYNTFQSMPPSQIEVHGIHKLGATFTDDLVLIGTRNGYFDDYDYNYNENLERTGDNSGILLLDDVDLTDMCGIKITDMKLQLFEHSSDVSIWYNARITNKDLVYTALIPPVMQNITSIENVSLGFIEHYIVDDEVISTNYSNVHGGNGDSSTYFGHSGGGYQRNLSLLQTTSMSVLPEVTNDNLTFLGSTGLIAQNVNFRKYAVRNGWSMVNIPDTVYEIYEGQSDTPSTKQAINTYWTDDNAMMHTLHVDFDTCEPNTSEWYLKQNAQGYDSTQGLLKNNNGEYMAYNPLTSSYVKVIDYTIREEIKVTSYWMDGIRYTSEYGYDADGNIYTIDGFSTIIEE